MTLLRRASLRHLLRHPGQLALSILGVALGVAVVVAIDLAIQSSREGFTVSAETVAGRATHQIVGGADGVAERSVAAVRRAANVEAAAPVVEGLASSPDLPGMALRVLGVDPFSEGPFRPYLGGDDGQGEDSSGEGGFSVADFITTPRAAVLSAATAERAGLRPGDSLVVMVGGRLVPLPVIATVDPTDELTRAGLRDVVLMDIASAQGLVGRPGQISRIDLRLAGSGPSAELSAVLPPGTRLEPAGTRTDTLAGMIGAFDLNLTALSFLAMIFGMFLIYNAQTFSVVQRRELLGGLRALGVTRGEVLRTVLGESVVIGTLGAALGVAAGVVLGRGLVGLVTRTINDLYFVLTIDGLSVPPAVLAKGAVLGLATTVLAALPPALEAASVQPRMARIRSIKEGQTRRMVPRAAAAGAALALVGTALLLIPTRNLIVSFAGLFLVLLGMALTTPLATVVLARAATPLLTRTSGILGTMAARDVVAALSRTAPAIAALVVAVSVTVGLGIMIQSFRGTLIDWLDGTLQADVYVSLPSVQAARAAGTLPTALLDTLVGHPRVVGRSTYRGNEVVLIDGVVRLVALDLDPRGEAAFDFLEGDAASAFPAFRTSDAVLVSEPLAYRRGLELGDSFSLPTSSGTVGFRIAGVFYDYAADQGVVMMSRRTYDRYHDDGGVTSLGLFLEEGVDVESVVRDLEARVPDGLVVTVRTNQALRRGSLEVFDRTFQVTAVLRLLAFVVAFVGVLSALMALELERSRELGVLRANGLTPGQVWQLVTTQTGLMGAISGILAVPMGWVLALVMIHVVNKRSFGWTLHMEVGPDVVLQALGLALVGAIVAGVYPAWRMSRVSPAEALRGE